MNLENFMDCMIHGLHDWLIAVHFSDLEVHTVINIYALHVM